MSILRRISARIFAGAAYAVLAVTGWKKKTVKANLQHVSQGTWGREVADFKSSHSEAPSCVILRSEATKNPDTCEDKAKLHNSGISPRGLYRRMLKSLTRHVGEMLFCFDTYKNLPEDCGSYPYKKNGSIFEIAEGATPVIETMRRGGIFLTAHYGNYEASGAWLCALGVPLKASFIPLKPAWLNRIVYEKIRCVKGRPYSIDAKTPREFLNLLDGKPEKFRGTCPKENGKSNLQKPASDEPRGNRQLFCLLADQDSRINSAMDGTFLRRPAKINPLPDFLLKHRPDTPVFFCWIKETRDPSRGVSRKILHAVEAAKYQPEHTTSLSDADLRQHDIKKNTCRSIVDGPYREWLEERIRENPALWYGWTHRRFKSMNPEIYP